MSKRNILLIGDSYGTARFNEADNNYFVPLQCTWPEIVKTRLGHNINFILNFRRYKKLIDICDEVILSNVTYDAIFIMAGIVDIFPRPLPHSLSINPHFLCRLIRQIPRVNKPFWIKHIFSKPYVCNAILQKKISTLLSTVQPMPVYFITYPLLHEKQAAETPGSQQAVKYFNASLVELSKNTQNCNIINFCQLTISKSLYSVVNEQDSSHLNLLGNKQLAIIVEKAINAYVKKCNLL